MPHNQPRIIELIDTHAHLDMPHFAEDLDETIHRARHAGIARIINVGIDLSSSLKTVELTHRYDFLSAAVGVHPQESKTATVDEMERLAELARQPGVIAIGEIGLDFFRDYSPREKQVEIFERQLELAAVIGLPVIVHCRQAESVLTSVLETWTQRHPCSRRGVIHCFSGNLETAQSYVRLGFYISLGAYIGYPSSKAFQEVIKHLPLERLLLETDCPFLPPQNQRGKRNEPAYMIETAMKLSEIKGLRLEETAQLTTSNAKKLFNLG